MARSSNPLPTRFTVALLALSTLSPAAGCAAYNKTMGAVMRNSNVIEGHVEATNTMSVPVCKITLSPNGGEPRDRDDLNGDVLAPGQSAQVDIPTIGDPMDLEAPQPEAWDIAVFGCKEGPVGIVDPGTVLVSYDAMPLEKDGTLTIR